MDIPEDLLYSADHEWVRTLASGEVEIGITDFAQGALGDIVYVQLPEAGKRVVAGQACAEVESVKSVSEIFAPLAGQVTAINAGLADAPEQVNQSPYGSGWLLRMNPDSSPQPELLLDAEAYAALVAQN